MAQVTKDYFEASPRKAETVAGPEKLSLKD